MSSLRFVHAADLHLGSLLKSFGEAPDSLKSRLVNAGYDAFKRIVDAAIARGARILLISGDVFDRESRTVAAERFFSAQCSRLNEYGIGVYLIHGNHDAGYVPVFEFPPNVTVFGSDGVGMAEVTGADGRLLARVLGQSYRARSDGRKMAAAFRCEDASVPNIALLHTDLNPKSRDYAPCSAEDLQSSRGIHYWALGHAHRREILSSDVPTIVYPGIPQGRDLGEPGPGGCYLVDLDPDKGASLEFIPTASVLWHQVEVPIDSLPAAIGKLEDILRREAGAIAGALSEGVEGHVVRWIITGRGELHHLLDGDEEVAGALVENLRQDYQGEPFVWTESVVVRTGRPLPDGSDLGKDRVLSALRDAADRIITEPGVRERALACLGSIWVQGDREDERPECFVLDEGILKELVDEAWSLAAERILEGRGEDENRLPLR